MYNPNNFYQCPYYSNLARSNSDDMVNSYGTYQCPCYSYEPMINPNFYGQFANQYRSNDEEADYDLDGDYSRPAGSLVPLKDYGPAPFVIDIDEATKRNKNYRTTLWTGNHLQLTLMSIRVGEDIGVEVHPVIDQFIRVEEGQGIAEMGPTKNNLNYRRNVSDGSAIFVPAGTWHNVVNTGNKPLKLYSIYAPPQHPHGTVHATKAIAHGGSAGQER
jgi:mannose-6-phosphate isomerase-like protein (cupin superfamily)